MTEMIETFADPGISQARLTMKAVPSQCALVEDTCAFDIEAAYEPGATCITIEWFAAIVTELTTSPTTAEGLAVALKGAIEAACGPNWVGVTVTHHEKAGVVLVVEAMA
jgi:hypothetical protein